MKNKKIDDTKEIYNTLNTAYERMNKALFYGKLPECVIVLKHSKRSLGYFQPKQWRTRDDEKYTTDELCMNPSKFIGRDTKTILSTLLHEMCHVWQEHHGTPSRGGYHNTEWGARMKSVGLYPSNTGFEGGKETGQQMTHYIIEGGRFDKFMSENSDLSIDFVRYDTKPKKSVPKTKFTCPKCGCNAWGKESLNLTCGDCNEIMLPN